MATDFKEMLGNEQVEVEVEGFYLTNECALIFFNKLLV